MDIRKLMTYALTRNTDTDQNKQEEEEKTSSSDGIYERYLKRQTEKNKQEQESTEKAKTPLLPQSKWTNALQDFTETKRVQRQTQDNINTAANRTRGVINPAISLPKTQSSVTPKVQTSVSALTNTPQKMTTISDTVKSAVQANPPKPKEEKSKSNILERLNRLSETAGGAIATGTASVIDAAATVIKGIENVMQPTERTESAWQAATKGIFKQSYPSTNAYKGEEKKNIISKLAEEVIDKYTTGATDYLNSGKTQLDTVKEITERIKEDYKDLDTGELEQLALDVVYNIGAMAPSIYATAVGTALGLPEAAVKGLRIVTTFSNSSTRSIKRALEEGADTNDAIAYGMLSGVIESAGEELIGGFLGTGKGVVDTAAKKLASKFGVPLINNIKNPIIKGITNYAGGAIGEGVEEMVQEMLDVGAQKATYNPEAVLNAQEIAYAGVLGTLMGGFYSLPQAYQNTKQAYNTNKYIKNVASTLKNIDTKADVDEALGIIYSQYKTGENIRQQVADWDIDKSQKDFILTNIDYFNTQMKNLGSTLYQNQDEIINTNEKRKTATENSENMKTADDIVKNTSEAVRNAISNGDMTVVYDTIINSELQLQNLTADIRNNAEEPPEIKRYLLEAVRDKINNLESMTAIANEIVYENEVKKIDELVSNGSTETALVLIDDTMKTNNQLSNAIRNRQDVPNDKKINIITDVREKNSALKEAAQAISDGTYESVEIINETNLIDEPENGIINTESTVIDDVPVAETSVEEQQSQPPLETVNNEDINVDQSSQQIPADLDTSNVPQDTENSNVENVNNDSEIKKYNLAVEDYTHSQTGDKYILAKTDSRLSTDEFKELKNEIKSAGGYYSKYAKGFLVPADKGLEDINKLANVIDNRVAVANETEEPTEMITTEAFAEALAEAPIYDINETEIPDGTEQFTDLSETELNEIKSEYIESTPHRKLSRKQSKAIVAELFDTHIIPRDKEFNRATVSDRLHNAYSKMTYPNDDGEYSVDEAYSELRHIAEGIVGRAIEIDRSMEREDIRDIKTFLHNTPLYIGFMEKKDVAELTDGNVQQLNRENFGRVRFTNDKKALHLDSAYEELSAEYPSIFPPDIANASDRARQMIDFWDNYADVTKPAYDQKDPMPVDYITEDLLNKYFEFTPVDPPLKNLKDIANAVNKGENKDGKQQSSSILENENNTDGKKRVPETGKSVEKARSAGTKTDNDSGSGIRNVSDQTGVVTGEKLGGNAVQHNRTDEQGDIVGVSSEHVDGEGDDRGSVARTDSDGNRRPDVVELESADVVDESTTSKIDKTAAQNYSFSDTGVDNLAPSIKNNIDAIKLSKKIAEENRIATPQEQKILASYKGWGGLKEAFIEGDHYNKILKSLVTLEEYNVMRTSALSAYYTPLKLVEKMYAIAERLGFKSGSILEPAMGTGNFFGMIPKDIADNSKLHGVEFDPFTGQIAQQLYPLANIQVSPFEDVNFSDNKFDLVIGNVPFVNVKHRYKKKSYSLHDLFFVKSVDKVRSGGIAMLLTSTGTLDKLNTQVRDEIAKKADLIAAYRLPNNVFSTNAGTDVITDLIIFQKRPHNVPQSGETFSNLGAYDGVQINEYFVRHPENILGNVEKKKNQYGKDFLDVKSTYDKNYLKTLEQSIDNLPSDIMARPAEDWADEVEEETTTQELKSKFLVDKKGEIIFHDHLTNTNSKITGKDAIRAKHYVKINDLYNNLLNASLGNYTAEQRETLRNALNTAYDDFVNDKSISVGPNRLNDKLNQKMLANDMDYWKVAGLERYDTKTKEYVKSDILTKDTFSRKTPEKAATSRDGVAMSVNEKGKVDIKYIEKITGFNKDRILEETRDLIIESPDGDYELIPQYASGFIRNKLSTALSAVKTDGRFRNNVRILEAALPKLKTDAEITPQLGASWIGTQYVADFITETFGRSGNVSYEPLSGTWSVDRFYSMNVTANKQYSTSRVDIKTVIEAALNQKQLVVKDKFADVERVNVPETALARQKVSELKNLFETWVFKDNKRRDDLVNIYNERFNDFKPMDYRAISQHLTLPGLAEEFNPRDYQKDAVARVLFGGNTLLAHGVGTGKTAEMIMSAMELKRLGIANKVMMVVPNNKLDDFRIDILKTYPAAKVLLATEKDFKKENRARLFSTIGSNDWDIVIVAHSSFTQIPLSNESQQRFIQEEVDEIEQIMTEAAGDKAQSRRFVSQLAKSLSEAQQKLKKLLDIKRDETITFEEMGVDALFVDEAHNYKNLAFKTKLSISGVTPTASQRATDMLMKTNLIRSMNGRVVFATATPITNSISEMYNMTRFVSPETLEQANIKSFDAWVSTFGEVVSKAEVSPDGRSMRVKERLSKYNNVPEMVGLFRQFADILRTEEVIQDLPKAKYVEVVSPSTGIHDRYIEAIMDRINNMKSGQKATDNMLLVTNDGRAMATDMRLVANQLGGYTTEQLDLPTSRINQAVTNVVSEYKKSTKTKGTQFVFLDFGMSSGDDMRYNFNLYADIKAKLTKNGIPIKEIAEMGDYNTAEKKAKLFESMNKGEIRVLIGSTAKMGEGVNAQQKAVALHHLNAPYRPSDIEQREGRIVRYGNENKDVTIYKYIQEKSFDSYMWQMLARKATFINQAMSGGSGMSLEEIDEFVLSAQSAMAIATGNPLILRQVEVDQELKQLSVARYSYLRSQFDLQNRIAALPNEIKQIQNRVAKLKSDSEMLKKTEKDKFVMVVGNSTYTKHSEAGTAILAKLHKNKQYEKIHDLGTYRGFELKFNTDNEGVHRIYIDGKHRYDITASESNTGIIARIDNELSKIPERLETHLEMDKVQREELSKAKAELGKPFPKQKEFDKLTIELNDINTKLGAETGFAGGDTSEVFEVDISDTGVDIGASEVDAYIGYDRSSESSETTWAKQERISETKKHDVPDLTRLSRDLTLRFGIPVNKGKLPVRGAEGAYKHKPETIRIRMNNAVPIIAHELGHHFDNKYQLVKNNLSGFEAVQSHYQNKVLATGEYELNEVPKEALAEYFRDYISNKKAMTELFPEFTNTIKSVFSNSDWQNLNAYAKDVNDYLSATEEERFKSTIHRRQTYNKFKEQLEIIRTSPKTAANKALDAFVYNWFDTYSTIKYAELKSVGTTRVYDRIMQSNNIDLKAQQSLLYGLRDLNGSIIAPGLQKYIIMALSDSPENAKRTQLDLGLYLKNRRAPELIERDIRVYADETLNNQEAVQRSISQLENKYPNFEKGAKGIYEFQDEVLYTYGVETGLISERQYERIKELNKFYVPLSRVIEKAVNKGGEIKKGIANQHSTVKRIRGSGLDTYDPVENIVYSTTAIMKAGTRNSIMLDLANIADNTPGFGVYMEKIPPDMVANVVSLQSVKEKIAKLSDNEELNKILEKLDEEDIDYLIDTISDTVGDTIKTYKSKRSEKNNVISVKRNGEYVYYEVHDDYFLKGIQSLTPSESGIVMETMRVLTTNMKVLTTGANPFFGIWNVMKDFPTGLIGSATTKNPIKYTIDWVSAAVGVISESENYKSYLANGGGYLGSVTARGQVFNQTMRELTQTDRNKFKKAIKNGKHLVDNVLWIVNKGDDVPRFAEYQRTLKKTGDQLTAGRTAQEATVNFRRSGKIVKEIDKIIPFLNPAFQGLYHGFNNFFLKGYDEYLKTGSKKAAIDKLWGTLLLFLIGSLFSAALKQYWNRRAAPELLGTDPNDFENASSYMKNNFHLFALPNGRFIRIPKPQNMGLLDSLMERSLDYFMYEDPNAYYNFIGYVGSILLPPTTITLFGTAIELAKNENFAGIPIVPSYMENYDKRLQYDDTTSAVAVMVGQAMNMSPKQVDYFLTSNTGFIGRINQKMFPVSAEKRDWAMGLNNQFVVDSTYSTDIVNRFYDERDEYTKMATSYNLTNGEDERYTYEDVYNKNKYDKYASLYSKVTSGTREGVDEEEKRNVRKQLNNIIGGVVDLGMTEIDEFVSYAIQEYGYEINDIAPYITIPSTLTYKYTDDKGNHYVKDKDGNNIKTELQYEDIISYYIYFNREITDVYNKILKMDGIHPITGTRITDQDKAETMIAMKDKLAKEMELNGGAELFEKYKKE